MKIGGRGNGSARGIFAEDGTRQLEKNYRVANDVQSCTSGHKLNSHLLGDNFETIMLHWMSVNLKQYFLDVIDCSFISHQF